MPDKKKAKRKLPPALQANADKLKRGESLSGKKKSSTTTRRSK